LWFTARWKNGSDSWRDKSNFLEASVQRQGNEESSLKTECRKRIKV